MTTHTLKILGYVEVEADGAEEAYALAESLLASLKQDAIHGSHSMAAVKYISLEVD